MKNKNIAKEIINNIGGQDNILSYSHCITRIRFVLKDKTKPNKEKLENIDGVISVREGMGEYQVVLGNKVQDVYEEVTKLIGEKGEESESEQVDDDSFLNKVIRLFASIFTPIIPVLAGAGMIIGVLELINLIGAAQFNFDFEATDTYKILNATADAVFYFMPVMLGYTSGKTFKTNPFLGMVIGAALIHPDMISLLGTDGPVNLIGIPITKEEYASSVIPIIIAVLILSYVEKFLNNYIPEAIKLVVVPALSLLIMLPATLSLFGPIGTYIGDGLSIAYNSINSFSPALSGAFIGGMWGIFVIFGGHRAIVPIGLNDLATTGRQTLFAFTSTADISQAGAAMGVYLKTKDKKLKTISLSASITALFGVTEPAIYGVNLRFKKPLICAVIAGALGGGFIGWSGSYATTFANQGILSIAPYAAPGFKLFFLYIIGVLIAFFGAVTLTYFFGYQDEGDILNNTEEKKEKEKEEILNNTEERKEYNISVPIKGSITDVKTINDQVFASESLGKGLSISPSEGIVYAPESGTVSLVATTMHAVGLQLDNGAELMVHIGLDTVKLEGKYFQKFVEQGQKVNKGDKLISFDINAIQQEGYDISTAVVVTNSQEFEEIKTNHNEHANLNDIGITIKSK